MKRKNFCRMEKPRKRQKGKSMSGKRRWMYTGSYNAPVLTGDGTIYHGNGKGIQVYLFDEEEGTLEEVRSYPEVQNASWLTFSADGEKLYAVNELDDYEGTGGGAVSAFAVKEGELQFSGSLAVMGAAPCHVNCDRSGRHIYTANYNGGSLSSFALNEDGSLSRLDGQIQHEYRLPRPEGIDRLRQEKPHVHSASVYEDFLWITDLGLDEVSVYPLDEMGNVAADQKASLTLPAGSGPRSIAFGEKRVYVSCELSNEIAVIGWEKEAAHRGEAVKLELLSMVSSLPGKEQAACVSTGITEEKLCAKNSLGGILLSSDGNYLYAGNRGGDNIAVFSVDNGGFLRPVQWITSHGANPRGFTLSPSGGWLLVANQDSDGLVVFKRNPETGILTEHRRYEAGAVVCLAFL